MRSLELKLQQMYEAKPSLSEIADTIFWCEGWDIDQREISAGLKKAGIDPGDEKERLRLQSLVVARHRLRDEDSLCHRLAEVDEFLCDARKMAGSDADIDEVIELAQQLKQELQDDPENDQVS